jgi:mannose-6-phosphate isomerase
MNHMVLQPGQAVFLAAGNLHAYLEGAGVELMANSDNVVRGGLTPKHVDAEELVAVLDTTTGPPPVQTADGPSHSFDIPAAEFALTRLKAGDEPLDERFEPAGPEIVLVTEGLVELRSEGRDGGPATSLTVSKGQAALVVWSDGPYRVISTGPTVAWRAAVGLRAATA